MDQDKENLTVSTEGFAHRCNVVFDRATADYHITDSIDADVPAPFPAGSIEALLYAKNWIDVAQWHMEDLIRDPQIDPAEGMKLKRRIDASNQDRTDRVEDLDTYFRDLYKAVEPLPQAQINTESPAWALDRLSILAVKIFHMKAETERATRRRSIWPVAAASWPCCLSSAPTSRRPSTPCLATSPPAANI